VSPPAPVVAVGAVAVVDGRVLLIRRGQPPEAGLWSIPGGRVEPGEPLTDAVRREVAEETGLAVTCGRLVGWAERIGSGSHYVILDFAVTVDGGTLRAGSDAAAACWQPLDRLDERPLVSGLARFFATHGVTAAGG